MVVKLKRYAVTRWCVPSRLRAATARHHPERVAVRRGGTV